MILREFKNYSEVVIQVGDNQIGEEHIRDITSALRLQELVKEEMEYDPKLYTLYQRSIREK